MGLYHNIESLEKVRFLTSKRRITSGLQVLHWQPQPTPAPRPTSVTVSLALSRCQAAPKGVRIVPLEYRESRRGVQRGQCQTLPVASAAGGGRRRSAAGGARATLIGPDIGNNTISVYPDIAPRYHG
jgi:hypothetical protein